MAPDALTPNDPRAEHRFATVGAHTYHYLLAEPARGPPVATALLLHGFPDLCLGWRFQVPFLLSLGIRVVVPDLLGYGQTSAPDDAAAYSFRKMSDDLAQLVRAVEPGQQRLIVGGHDWGAALMWRLALWHPSLVRCLFSICVPFLPPRPGPGPPPTLDDVVRALPSFAYQRQFAGPEAERLVGASPDRLRGFLRAVHGGGGPAGEPAFAADRGVIPETLDAVGPAPLMGHDVEDHYAAEFARHGLHGPLNWYRTRELEWEEERALLPPRGETVGFVDVPAMVVMAEQDVVLRPEMANGMERWFEGSPPLRKELVDAGHWALVQRPDEVNGLIGDFLRGVYGEILAKASL